MNFAEYFCGLSVLEQLRLGSSMLGKTKEEIKEIHNNMETKRLILNSIQCKHCLDIITSHSVHNYVTCKCGKVSIDGGSEYQHISFTSKLDFKNLAVYSTDTFDKIRESFSWGSYGKSGKEEKHWIILKDMSDNHIKAILITQKQISDFIRNLFIEEQKYRKDNNITIKE